MRTIQFKVYEIDEHPAKENIFNWIRGTWFDLNEFDVYDLILSLEGLKNEVGGDLHFSISCPRSYDSFIRLSEYDEEALRDLNAEECPLTGCFWDIEVIEALKEGSFENVWQILDETYEYRYSDEGLAELCRSNEYEFYEDGSIC